MLPDIEDFTSRVYHIARQIPAGAVATYGQIAHLAGKPRAARAVGNALKALDEGIPYVPWHRVLNARGAVSGATPRAMRQRDLLTAEGVEFNASHKCKIEELEWEPEDRFWSVDWDTPE